MAISGVARTNSILGYMSMQANRKPTVNDEVRAAGERQTGAIAAEGSAYSRVSNFGNETKGGSSRFQQDNDKTVGLGGNWTSDIAQTGHSYYQVSNFGNETKGGSSRFSQGNADVLQAGNEYVSTAMRRATEAYAQNMQAMRQKNSASSVDIAA